MTNLERETNQPDPILKMEVGKEYFPFKEFDFEKQLKEEKIIREIEFLGIKGNISLHRTDFIGEAFNEDLAVEFPLGPVGKEAFDLSYNVILENFDQYSEASKHRIIFTFGEKWYRTVAQGDSLLGGYEDKYFDLLDEAMEDFEQGLAVNGNSMVFCGLDSVEIQLPINKKTLNSLSIKVKRGWI